MLAGGALALSACGPMAYDAGYGYGFPEYDAPYYAGYYGGPYYRPGVVFARPGHGYWGHGVGWDHDRHETFDHQRREAREQGGSAVAAPNIAARPLPPVAYPERPITRPMAPPQTHAAVPPPPGRHHF
jgi:hypothetical protein